jgi:hypothetical protein
VQALFKLLIVQVIRKVSPAFSASNKYLATVTWETAQLLAILRLLK